MVQSNMDTAKKIAEVLEEMVLSTGWMGPYILGSVLCDLCGQLDHVMLPIKMQDRPGDLRLFCSNCGQRQVDFMDLGEAEQNGW